MSRAPITDDMTEGYLDGLDPDMPEPSANRSATYRHGFKMGRNDKARSSGEGARTNLLRADAATSEELAKRLP